MKIRTIEKTSIEVLRIDHFGIAGYVTKGDQDNSLAKALKMINEPGYIAR